MKTLLLMRHAKSSWGNESLPDFERALNERGKRDAPRIGRELLARGAVPDVIVTSSAVRAMETTRLVCEGLAEGAGTGKSKGRGGVLADLVSLEPTLYGATSDRIMEKVNLIHDDYACALVVGHNPGMQDLVTSLAGQWLPEGMKTATVACIQFDVADWSQANETNSALEWVLYPNQVKG